MTHAPHTLSPGARVHLVGIGGSGMSALAQLLLERGHPVSGSDLRGGGMCMVLEAMGASVHVGHEAHLVEGADLVVVSNAVPAGNVERVRATELGIPVIIRAELLELLLAGHRRLLVTGTHGKTTTTSMATVALQHAGLDPSFAIGGALRAGGTSAHRGTGEVFVAEADEAFRSFLHLTPDCAVVTNAEMDHHDVYTGLEDVLAAFRQFLARRPRGGLALLCADDPGALELAADADQPVQRYGVAPEADWIISDIAAGPERTTFQLTHAGTDLGRFALGVPGHHNVLNAAAAVAAAAWAGADPGDLHEAFTDFRGAGRRFQILGSVRGITVVDDYGHHPTELRATISAARQLAGDGRVVAVFQPHRYSRTAVLGEQLGRALADADLAVVTDVYAANEAAVAGVTGELVADAALDAGVETRFLASLSALPAVLSRLVQPGDVVLTMGAGDITTVGPQLLRQLEGG
ncbi:MAG: UDP-N-acetylmuramate--L-alanine ligase [Actinobacteria bacterium]|nr:UDP-N-acetylmuramate--L-alanine ligase [Actinomycetota bacterium]